MVLFFLFTCIFRIICLFIPLFFFPIYFNRQVSVINFLMHITFYKHIYNCPHTGIFSFAKNSVIPKRFPSTVGGFVYLLFCLSIFVFLHVLTAFFILLVFFVLLYYFTNFVLSFHTVCADKFGYIVKSGNSVVNCAKCQRKFILRQKETINRILQWLIVVNINN